MVPSLDAICTVQAFLATQQTEERRTAEEGMTRMPGTPLQFPPGTAHSKTSLQPTALVLILECGPTVFRKAEHVPTP